MGDTELGNTPQLPADPVGVPRAGQARALAAPIVFGNLEGTMTTRRPRPSAAPRSTECYAFRVPTAYARVYRATGFTVLNSANNHSHDFGDRGAPSTRRRRCAPPASPRPACRARSACVHDGAVKVAFVDFAPYLNTNDLLELPGGRGR